MGEEKEAGAFAGGCKEAKHVRAFATYQLLAAGTTFRTHFGPLLRLVSATLLSMLVSRPCATHVVSARNTLWL